MGMSKQHSITVLQLAVIASVMSLQSCRLNTDELTTVDSFQRDVPNIVIQNIQYKSKKNRILEQVVLADSVSVFTDAQKTEVVKGQVTNYNSQGSPQLRGSADFATYSDNTEDADVKGSIEVYYFPDKLNISAETLNWVNKDRTLVSGTDEQVTILKDDGTSFKGKGFSVDMKTKTVSYEHKSQGSLSAEENATSPSGEAQ